MNGRSVIVMAVVAGLTVWPGLARAVEHGGKEHAGTTQEHGGTTQGSSTSATAPVEVTTMEPQPAAEPTAEQLRQTIRDHIETIVSEEGAFTIEDEETGAVRTLEFVRVHERVGKTGNAYYSCTDMKDTATGELLDLDFDVEQAGSELFVTDTRIHKVNGNARYTYDSNDNRIPLPATSGN